MTQAKKILHPPFNPLHLRKGGLQTAYDFLCVDCGDAFSVNSGFALRCKPCKKKHLKAYMKKYHAAHPQKR